MKKSIQEFMSSDLITVSWNMSISDAYTMMTEKNIRHLPVLSADNELVGILSDKDIQRAMRIERREFSWTSAFEIEFDRNSLVCDYMNWPVMIVDSSRLVTEAAQIMINEKVSALLVAHKNDIVGIVTTEDLLRALVVHLEPTPAEKLKGEIEDAIIQSKLGQIAQALANVGI